MNTATSRRTLIGSSAAMLLAGALEAGASKADELDRDIIQASGNYIVLEAEFSRLCKLEDDCPIAERDAVHAQILSVNDQQAALRDIMVGTPARTPEGLRAKASALQTWLPFNPAGTAPYRDEDELAWSLCSDLLGKV